jgi:aspartate aminotransferase-like enzyme
MIKKEKPAVVFAPHVETSTGIILPENYITKVAEAVHSHGGLFVLDCIASGTVWVDMKKTGVDCILSAPQKGWTGPACASLMMLSERGDYATRNTTSTSMVINMRKWLEVMDSYVSGGFAYYTTMPTDALNLFRDAALETKEMGFGRAADAAWALGDECRAMMKSKGLRTVSAPGFEGTCCAFPKSRHCLMPLFGCTTSNTTRNLYHYWQLPQTRHSPILRLTLCFTHPKPPASACGTRTSPICSPGSKPRGFKSRRACRL